MGQNCWEVEVAWLGFLLNACSQKYGVISGIRIEESTILLADYKPESYLLKVPMSNWTCEFHQNNVRDIRSRAPLVNHKSCIGVLGIPLGPFRLQEKAPQFYKQTLPLKIMSKLKK